MPGKQRVTPWFGVTKLELTFPGGQSLAVQWLAFLNGPPDRIRARTKQESRLEGPGLWRHNPVKIFGKEVGDKYARNSVPNGSNATFSAFFIRGTA